MGRFSFVRWSLLFFVLILAAACGNGKSDGSSGGSADRTPPTVISTTPANGNFNVDINAAISATFSEGMDPASLSTSTFTLADDGGYLGGSVIYSAATRVVSFIPTASLSPDTRYFVTITTGAKDVSGNALAQGTTWVFRTNGGSDMVPPTVVAGSNSPANGAVDVPLATFMTVTFSESMDPASMDSFSFYLLEKNLSFVPANVSYNDATKVATLVPSQPLKDDTSYTVWVTNWATDKADNPLSPEVTWTFKTVDLTSPEVISVSPASGAGGVAASSAVTATFSESVDGTTINASTFKLTGPSGDVAGAVAYNGATRVATFTPANVLQDDSIYFAIVTTGVKDLSGNALASQMSWNFITRDTVGPFVAYMSPKAGALSVQVDTSVTATFSEPIDPVTVNTRTLKVEDVSNVPAVQVPGLVTYNALTQVAAFTPHSDLANATQYRVTVTTDVRDNSGNQLQAPTSWTFTTSASSGGGGDTVSPSVASTSPAKNAVNVAVVPGGNLISVTFNEAVDPSSLTGNLMLDGASGLGLISYDEITNTATFLAPLNLGARYVIVVTTGVKDLAGNNLDVEVRWPFTTAADATDKVAPTITGVAPASGAIGVSLTTGVSVTFNEAMDAGTFTTATVSLLTADNEPVDGIVTYDAGTMTANFQPPFSLLPNTLYVVVVTTGVTDLAGNPLAVQRSWSFRTLDLTPPTVLTFAPVNFATSVPVDSVVTATFSEAMNAATLTTSTFTLTDPAGATVAGAVAYDASTKTATFTPGAGLTPSTVYLAKLTMAVADAAGNKMASQIAWRFTTIDNVAPTLVTRNPAPNAVAVSAAVKVQTMFSEAVDPTTVNVDSVKLATVAGVQVAGTVAYDGNTRVATFTPAGELAALTAYRVTVTTQVRDLAGNQLAAAQTWDFTTASGGGSDSVAPAVISTSPAKDAVNVAVAPLGNLISVTFSEAVDPSTLENAISIEGINQLPAFSYDEATLTATFNATLAHDTRYVIVVTTGVKDLAGNNLDVEVRWPFTTASALDDQRPSVASFSPANGDTQIALDEVVFATFSEPMDAATITAASFTLTDETGGGVAGTVAYDAVLRTATFTPDAPLTANTYYMARVTLAASDAAGNPLAAQKTWGFTTLDNISPTVVATNPASNAVTIPVTTSIQVLFSEPVDPASVTLASLKLATVAGDQVPGTVQYDANTNVATFTPSASLTAFTAYRATVTKGVRDLAGNQLAALLTWDFTTSVGPDEISPNVFAVTPLDGANNVSQNSAVTVTFDETMNAASISITNFYLLDAAGEVVDGTITYSALTRTATFRSALPLRPDALYVAVVSTAVEDAAGNGLSGQYSWSFSTIDLAPPLVLAVSPGDGAVQVPVGSVISMTFSEAMDPLSITAAGTVIVLDDAGVAVPGSVAYDAATNSATFTSNNLLDADTTYLVRVTLGATDLAGNLLAQEKLWGFRTVDSTPPTVLSMSPAPLAATVSIESMVEAVFSEAMAASTINQATFILTEVATDVDVVGSVLYIAATRTAIFMPYLALDPLTQYRATLTTGATDSGSNPLAADVIWTFTTDTESSIRPPSVTAVTPANGAANVALNAAITATFSKPVDASTLTTDSFVLTDGNGNVVAGGVSYDAATTTLTFVPDAALASDSFYVAQILASVTDTEGVAMARGEVWSFRTTAVGVTLPAVTATVPATGELNVAEGSDVTVTFNKAMDPATINASTITLSSALGAVAGRVTYDTGNDFATFTPLLPLKSNTFYTATVTAGAKDLSGRSLSALVWSFTTADSSPTVAAVTPIDKSTGFAVTGKIYVDFNEDMDPLTVNAANILMTGPGGPVVGTVSYTFSAGLYRATFTPNTTLSANSYYVMQVTTGVKDLSGNPLDNPFVWSFTTNVLVDTVPPTVMGNIPWNGATHMSVVNKVSATFSEAMDTSSLAAAFTLFDMSDPMNPVLVPGRIDYDNTTHVATFVPDAQLLNDTDYSATISILATDVAGNAIEQPVNWSFTTIDDSKTTYDFSGYFTGQYISSATKQEGVALVLLQPAGKSTPAGPGNDPPAVDVNATFIGNFSTDSGILGTVSGSVSGDAASITVTYSKSGCTGTFSGSAVGLLSGGSNITMNFIGQACNGPEFVSIGVLQRVP